MNQIKATIQVAPSKKNDQENRNIKSKSREADFNNYYDFGFRKMGDKLLDFKRHSYQWTQPQDIELTLFCPAARNHRVSSVNIKIDQSSQQHDAKIIDGGIDKNFIEILVTLRNTYWFEYEASFYGRPAWLQMPLQRSNQ